MSGGPAAPSNSGRAGAGWGDVRAESTERSLTAPIGTPARTGVTVTAVAPGLRRRRSAPTLPSFSSSRSARSDHERSGGPEMSDAQGWTAEGWEGVRDAFAANLAAGLEIGASFAAYHKGRKVVDLW